jgi:hypothetical protein
MSTRVVNQRFYGFFGFLGFLGFIPALYYCYMFFMFFFFFVYAQPKTEEGTVLSDERWGKNLTKAARNAFLVFLIPSILNIAFFRAEDTFLWVTASIPIAALLGFVASFVYYDLKGE